jgi:hypothetical protein
VWHRQKLTFHLPSLSCAAAADLAKVSAPPVWAVTVAYPSSAFRAEQKCFDEAAGKLAAFGVLIPRASGLKVCACCIQGVGQWVYERGIWDWGFRGGGG